jgi:hypothetical protein
VNVYLAIFLGMSAAAVVIVLAAAIILLRTALRTKRASDAIQAHPTIVALKGAQAIGDQLRGLGDQVARIRVQGMHIAQSMAQISAAAALLDLEVDRVSFATRLLLKTFIPTLRGSMAD